jgi:hypothetical protein
LPKFKAEPPSELSIFLEYMEPFFGKICDETNEYARVQLNNPNRKKLKDDEKWFDTTHSLHREETKRQKGVLCATEGAKGVKVFGSANSVGLPFI